MKKVVAFANKQEVSRQLARFEDTKPLIDKVLAEWEKLKLDPINLETLSEILNGANLQQIVRRSIVDGLKPEDLRIAGRPASREAMASLLTPPDLTDLEDAISEASMHQTPLQICRIHSNRIEIDKSKFEELQQANTVLTDDLETLTQVKNIISGIKFLIDRNLVPKGVVSDLQRWKIIDPHVGDGLQPSRNLFKKQ